MSPPIKKPKTKKQVSVLPFVDGILKHVILLTRFPSKICCISYYWNDSIGRFVSLNESLTKIDSLKWLAFKRIQNFMAMCSLALILQLIIAGGFEFHPGRPLIQSLMESFTIIAVGGCAFGRWMYFQHALSFTNCFNNLLLNVNRQNCK